MHYRHKEKPIETPNGARNPLRIHLTSLYVGMVVASAAAANKVISLPGGLGACATVFSYIIAHKILLFIVEEWGRVEADTVIHSTLIATIVAIAIYQCSILAPPSPTWRRAIGPALDSQVAYAFTLGSTARLFFGGQLAFLVSSRLGTAANDRLKRANGNRHIWLRTYVTPQVVQLVDTAIFVGIAFFGYDNLVSIIIGQHLVKIIFSLILSVPFDQIVRARKRMLAHQQPILD